MRRKTLFAVQTYQRRRGQLRKSVCMQFTSASEAEEVATALQGQCAAIVVYLATVLPGCDQVDDCEVFSKFGAVDEIVAA